MDKYNVIIAGVGGQGVVLAGNIIGEAAMASGYDVKKTDMLGMAQRGGSVISHLRMAYRVFSPLINQGEADILLAFEKLEAARWSHYLKPSGIAIINNQALPPLSVNLGNEHYPGDEEIVNIIKQQTVNLYIIDGIRIVMELGNVKTLNVLMLGCLSHFIPFTNEVWRSSIIQNLPSKVLDFNMNAFEIGMKEIKDMVDKKMGNKDA